MNKLIRKFTSYDQDLKNEYNRGRNDAIRNMSETQKAQERTAADGLIVTSEAAINKRVEDAVANEAYRLKQNERERINKICRLYEIRIAEIDGNNLPPEQGMMDTRERDQGERAALLRVINDLRNYK